MYCHEHAAIYDLFYILSYFVWILAITDLLGFASLV